MVFPSINLLFWSVLTPHVSVIIESMLNQAWSPGYLSIFLSKHFPLWPVSGPPCVGVHGKRLSIFMFPFRLNVEKGDGSNDIQQH